MIDHTMPYASSTYVAVALLGLVAASCGVAGEAHREMFPTAVASLLKNHCIDCHGPDVQEADLRLDTLDRDMADGKDLEMWIEVRRRLVAGEMPPEGVPRPSEKELSAVVAWLASGMIEAAKTAPLVAAPPYRGNLVDHDLLFGPAAAKLAAATPARLWRASPQIYFKFLQDLDPDVSSYYDNADYELGAAIQRFLVRYSQPFTASSAGFADFSGTATIDSPTAALLVRNAQELVRCQTSWRVNRQGQPEFDHKGNLQVRWLGRKDYAAFMPLVDTRNVPTSDQLETGIRLQFQLAVQREPTEDELANFMKLMQQNIEQAGQVEGARATLAAVVLLPEVIFRSEVGQGAPDEHGRRMLGPRELADAIAFALTDRRPDAALLAAADEGRLATRDDVRREALRILDDPKIDKPRILRFFREYFGYAEAISVFKDQQTVSNFRKGLPAQFHHGWDAFSHFPDLLVRDTDQLIEYILKRDQDVFKELLTTNKAFVSSNGDKDKPFDGRRGGYTGGTRAQYNLEKWSNEQPLTLPADQRAGILTQPSWLMVYSFNERTDVIHRGKWVREKLLGAALPGVPAGVDATVPESPDKTMRERMQLTKQQYCWTCHKKMDPLGFSFEMFDHFGRIRTEELGRPIDTSGGIGFSGVADLDGPVKNSVEMIKRIAATDLARQVFIRHAFRYWMGRAETLRDAATLQRADHDYLESGGSFNALIASLLTSDSFLYRVGRLPGEGPPPQPEPKKHVAAQQNAKLD